MICVECVDCNFYKNCDGVIHNKSISQSNLAVVVTQTLVTEAVAMFLFSNSHERRPRKSDLFLQNFS